MANPEITMDDNMFNKILPQFLQTGCVYADPADVYAELYTDIHEEFGTPWTHYYSRRSDGGEHASSPLFSLATP
jgi:hypothetical protein